MLQRFFMAFICLCLSQSCVHLNSASLTQIPQQRSQEVQAESSKFIILGFTFSNEFADQIVPSLARQCSGGQVQGILTKDEFINYFLFLVAKQRIIAKGYCVKNKVEA